MIKIGGIKYSEEKDLLDNGLINIGYSLEEAIMEAIDDSFDAGADNIKIKIFEEQFSEINITNKSKESEISEEENNEYEGKIATRYSYIVCDNGKGTKKIKSIFDFGKSENKINKNDYFFKNGKFHYGCISHINVADEIVFYSKIEENSIWQRCSLKYDRYNNCGYKSEVEEMTTLEKNKIKALDIEFPKKSGSVLYVKGIRKTEVDFIDIDKYIKDIRYQLGITYKEYLNEVNNNQLVNKIFLNEKEVVAIDPLCEELIYDESIDENLKPRVFAEYSISLEHVLEVTKDAILKNELINKYSNVFSEKELLELTMQIKLVAISSNLMKGKDGYHQAKKNPKFKNIHFPNLYDSGFYNKRNKRYVGTALGMLNVVKTHNSHNRFRGEISFSPVFDDFFKIQVNKNSNKIAPVMVAIIREAIANDTNLSGENTNRQIIYALDEIDSKTFKIESGRNNSKKSGDGKIDKVRKDKKLKSKRSNLKKRANKIKENLEKYYQDTNIIDDIISEINNSSLQQIEEFQITITSIESKYEEDKKSVFNDIDFMIERINKEQHRKILANLSEQGNLVEVLDEVKTPMVEGELYGIFCLMYSIFPEEFEFNVIGYHTRNGLDLIVSIPRDMYEDYKFPDRFKRLEEKRQEEVYNEDNYKYCTFVEIKNLLEPSMNHSLDLVSHILCWEKPDFNQITDKTGLIYTFTSSQDKNLLVNSNRYKVKVIYLKEIIERVTGGRFEDL